MKSIYFDVSIPRILATKALGGIFPSVYFSRLSPVRYNELPDIKLPGPNWVRVKPRLTGICGADLSLFFVKASPGISIAALPGVPRVFMGHELIGSVVETGANVKHLNVGDRVTMQRYLPCCSMLEIDPPCEPCRSGNYPLCENFSEGRMPTNTGAGFSDHFASHASQMMKVPDNVTDEEAVLIEPASVSLHAVLKRPPAEGETVLVIGAGTIGLNVIQLARALSPDCKIYVLERIAFKKELACKLGADAVLDGDPYDAAAQVTGGKVYRGPLKNTTMLGGFDLIYDCVGYNKTVHDALRWLKAHGTYVMIGNQLSPITFDQTPLWNQELTMLGVNSHGMENWQGRTMSSFDLAMEMISARRISLDGFITHRFNLGDYKAAFRLALDKPGHVIKVIFEIG